MRKFVDDIPAEFLPSEEEHVEHKCTVRALRDGKCDTNSFYQLSLKGIVIRSC